MGVSSVIPSRWSSSSLSTFSFQVLSQIGNSLPSESFSLLHNIYGSFIKSIYSHIYIYSQQCSLLTCRRCCLDKNGRNLPNHTLKGTSGIATDQAPRGNVWDYRHFIKWSWLDGCALWEMNPWQRPEP